MAWLMENPGVLRKDWFFYQFYSDSQNAPRTRIHFKLLLLVLLLCFVFEEHFNSLSSSNPVSRASMKLGMDIYHFPILFRVTKYTTHKSSFQVFFIAYILYIVFHVWKENYNMFEMNLINQYLKLLLYMCLSVLTIHFRF